MKEVVIFYEQGSYTREGCTDTSCIISSIKVSRKSVNEVVLEDNTKFAVDQETDIKVLEEKCQTKWKKYDVYMSEIEREGEEKEEMSEVDLHYLYASSGCESFDEFIDLYNSGELDN